MKKLPVGIESFSNIIKKDYYYVDKTNMIKDLLNLGSAVTLFTRPRRFGKSLNINMLKMFFSTDTDTLLFNGLAISMEKELCREYQGKFPVISISLKDVDGITFEDFIGSLKFVISEGTVSHKIQLLQSSYLDAYDKEYVKNITSNKFMELAELTSSLKLMTRFLYQHYGKKVIVLIDEYDVPLDKAYQKGFYNEMVTVIRLLFSSVLKTNEYLEFAVLTGCLRVSKESIFTGLNNFDVKTISDNSFSGYFGFTGEEVKEMLEYYGLDGKYPLFKEWYDGYKFGNTEVYCPWDVINQCSLFCEDRNAVMKSYWINSSGNNIVKDIIKKGPGKTKSQLEALVSGESIQHEIIQELTYPDLDDTDNGLVNLWSMLYNTGYLTDACVPAGDIHTLVIPNLEIYKIYEKQILPLLKERILYNKEQWGQFCQAVAAGNAVKTEEFLGWFLFNNISIRDTYHRKDIKENFYHGFLLMALSLNDTWNVRSNVESGTGYPDILVEDEKGKTGWVFELKYAEDKENDVNQDKQLEQACKEAIQQIKKHDYTAILRKEGMEKIYAFGIAFCRKKCKAACEHFIKQ